ncbi:MAG: ORF6N domain-containing protein [Candidatus Aenigmarchaeota archaeon]|nr:ORF6N domain-containing protein [Candidatus Aenigmarchaeota archaeon]
MSDTLAPVNQDNLKDKIYTIRGIQVMLDEDLSELYIVKTKRLNEQVKRNIERFPERFMFQLTIFEYNSLRFQNGTIESEQNLKSQNATSNLIWGGRRTLPYVFTEQGISMLSGVLKSDIAIKVSIQIMDAFVSMRKFISKNAELFRRLDTVERKQLESQIMTDKNFEKVFKAIENKELVKKQGIFFDGQIFDAYVFISDLIRRANKSIILIDNYIDDSVLTLFSKRRDDVAVVIYTKNITEQLRLDLAKYNSQYPNIVIKEFKRSHDRFMILDDKDVYHIGASLKDLGKRWFAFSKFDKDAFKLMERLELR